MSSVSIVVESLVVNPRSTTLIWSEEKGLLMMLK